MEKCVFKSYQRLLDTHGEIGIFYVNGESFVKQLGDGELLTLNKDYPNIELSEDVRCLGCVIGKRREDID
ncbi:MAG: S24 family peptidase [Lachnospiraceae bacterium]|jgi:SOS-response transcriptional repressor LexA|nr:S24 family peptidase [Lachnospiraceae bacterium]